MQLNLSEKCTILNVLQYGTEIIPIEVKGGEDKSAPSFKKYYSFVPCPENKGTALTRILVLDCYSSAAFNPAIRPNVIISA